MKMEKFKIQKKLIYSMRKIINPSMILGILVITVLVLIINTTFDRETINGQAKETINSSRMRGNIAGQAITSEENIEVRDGYNSFVQRQREKIKYINSLIQENTTD